MVEDTARNDIPDHGFTHSGVFHANDVFASALLKILNPAISIERGPSVPDDYEGIVFDIGLGAFDHHQSNKRLRKNGSPYAAFGLLWERYGTRLLDLEDAQSFDTEFIEPLDAADNNSNMIDKGTISLTELVSDFNPRPPAEPKEYDKAFNEAVEWAKDILSRRILRIQKKREDYVYTRNRMDSSTGSVLVLDRHAAWQQAVVDDDSRNFDYVIYPSARGGFNVQSVPEWEYDDCGKKRIVWGSMASPFPENWRGKPADELCSLAGVSDITFCHPSGFLCCTNTVEGALSLANAALNERS